MSSQVKAVVSGYEIESDILKQQDTIQKSFYSFGFKTLDPYLKLARGFPIYVGAYDSHGKTSLITEIQMQLAELYGMKSVVFSGEIGSVEDTYLELYNMYGKKPYNKYNREGHLNGVYQSDKERDESRAFVNSHFLVVDRFRVESGFDFDAMTSAIEEALNEGFSLDKVDTVSVDSWYELEREKGEGTDRQLEKFLQKVFRYGYKHKITFIISSHIGAMNHSAGMLEIPDTKAKYPKPPSKYAWSGGLLWSRMAFQLVNLYRPHSKIDYFGDGEMCAKNEAWIDVEKSKPKSIGKVGRCTLFYDQFKSRYYEVVDSERKFSRRWWEEDKPLSELQPNLDFGSSIQNDEAPF